MENIKESKNEFSMSFKALPEQRQADIIAYYDKSTAESAINEIIRCAKYRAEAIMQYADNRGYGYGEVGYNLNEEINDFIEEVPELKRQYKRLLYAYFDFITEAKTI